MSRGYHYFQCFFCNGLVMAYGDHQLHLLEPVKTRGLVLSPSDEDTPPDGLYRIIMNLEKK
uniref:Uncharacterized protein n=1 Tax=Arion vulgaris TaxID=1028688 RepID=A0A0B6Y8L7_9EUPU